MRLTFKKLVKNFAFYVFVAFVIVSFPSAIYESAEFERRAIFSSIAVDKSDEGYEISGLVIIQSSPEQISSNTQLVSNTGRNFSEALYKMSISMGKEIGLAHCDTFIVSDSLKDEDLAKVLNYCIRGNDLTQNTKIITCKGSAKDILKVNMEKKDEIGISLARSITTSSDFLAISDMELKEFYNRYYSKSSSCWTTVVEVAENDEGKSGATGESSQSSEKPQKTIKSQGEIALYKEGKLATIVEGDVANAINILNPHTKMGYMYLHDIPDGDKYIESMGLQIVQKSNLLKYSFKDSIPTLDMNVKLFIRMQSMPTDRMSVYDLDESVTHVSKNVEEKIKEYLNENLDKFIAQCDENKVDFFSISDRLYKMYPEEWKKNISEDEKQRKYIDKVNINLNIDIQSKL